MVSAVWSRYRVSGCVSIVSLEETRPRSIPSSSCVQGLFGGAKHLDMHSKCIACDISRMLAPKLP